MLKAIRFVPQVFLALLLIALGAGCSGKESAGSTAAGVVTVDGQPLQKGLVQFYPVGEGRSAFATIKEDGTFRVETTAGITGIEPGNYKVAVQYEVEDEGSLPFSEKYTSSAESGIEVTISESGDNQIEIKLTKAGDQ